MKPPTNENPELDSKRRRLVQFSSYEDWVAQRAYPFATRVTSIGIGVYLVMAVLEFLQESTRLGMAASIPYRVGTLACLVAAALSLKGTFSDKNRDLQATIAGSAGQLCLIAAYVFVVGRTDVIAVILLFYLFGALVLAPALRLSVYVLACVSCDTGTLVMTVLAGRPIEEILITFSIVLPAQGFLGYAIDRQRHYAHENWRLLRENYFQATLDGLSRVLNRRAWYERSEATLGPSPPQLEKEPHIAFLMLDIDHFKNVNDTWGHECGDVVIRQVADAILHETREGDLVGRLGGEEFGVLLAGTDPESTQQTAERIRQRVANTAVEYRGNTIHVTVSVGYCSSSPTTRGIDALIRAGDECLYEAKKSGRNKVVGHS